MEKNICLSFDNTYQGKCRALMFRRNAKNVQALFSESMAVTNLIARRYHDGWKFVAIRNEEQRPFDPITVEPWCEYSIQGALKTSRPRDHQEYACRFPKDVVKSFSEAYRYLGVKSFKGGILKALGICDELTRMEDDGWKIHCEKGEENFVCQIVRP